MRNKNYPGGDHITHKSNSKKLINGTMLYFIATFISKSMSLLMLPFITRAVAIEAYGYYDVLISLVPLLLPIFTIQSIEAIFRFLFDADVVRKKQLLSNLWIIVFVGNIVALIVMLLFNAMIYPIKYMMGFYLYYVVAVLLNMYQRVARSYGKSKQFATSGIINTFFMVIFQIISLYVLDAGVNGLLYSYFFAGLIACLYLEFHTKSILSFDYKYFNKDQIKEILKFGLPLVPNNIAWWASSSINKVIIITFISQSASGLFAVAGKFSVILAMLTGVFQLAWQESAIITYNSEDSAEYYSSVFNKFLFFVISICCLSIPIIKIMYPVLVAEDYISSWIYVPLLMFAACASSISLFYGAGYIASKKTKDAFWTTILGAGINILLCLMLIKPLGLFAPALSSLIAYMVIWIVRHYTMKKYFTIRINKGIIVTIIIMIIVSCVVYYLTNIVMNGLFFVILTGFVFFNNKDLLKSIFNKSFSSKML